MKNLKKEFSKQISIELKIFMIFHQIPYLIQLLLKSKNKIISLKFWSYIVEVAPRCRFLDFQ